MNEAIDWSNVQPHPALERLRQLCACGRDYGDHLVDGPHGCEETHCEAFAPRLVEAAAE